MKELSDEEKQGALNEAQVLQKLKHDNIIAYHEYFISSDKFLNIVMDYADGGDLFTKIKTAPTFLPEEVGLFKLLLLKHILILIDYH